MNPVCILFLAANPKDTTAIRISEEIRTIEERLRTTGFGGQFKIEQCWAVRVTDLPDALLRYKPQIVHFSGHGSASGQIILEDESGMAKPVSPKALSDLFRILKDDVQLVVLNACYSEAQADAISRHVRCVIGMSRAIDDPSAVAFAGGLYRGLGWGRSVDTSFDLGCNEIDLSSLEGADKPVRKPGAGADPAKMYLVQPDIPTADQLSKSVVTLGSMPSLATYIPFAVILSICTYLAWWIFERLGYTFDEKSFMVGIVVAALIGFTWFRVNDWWSSIKTTRQNWQWLSSGWVRVSDWWSSIRTIRAYTPSQAAIVALCSIVKLFLFIVFAIGAIYLIVRLS